MVVIEFCGLFLYISLIFFIKTYELLFVVFMINIVLMCIYKVSIRKTCLFLFKIFPVILLTALFNLLFTNLSSAMLVGIRLFLASNATYILVSIMPPRKLQIVIEKLLFPFHIFHINAKEIGMIISISLCLIPILRREIQNLKYSLIAKGFQFNLKNIIKKPNYILVPLLTAILKKTIEIEQSMVSKGYQA